MANGLNPVDDAVIEKLYNKIIALEIINSRTKSLSDRKVIEKIKAMIEGDVRCSYKK